MKKFVLVGFFALALFSWWNLKSRDQSISPHTKDQPTAESKPQDTEAADSKTTPPSIGDQFLEGFGSADSSPVEDVRKLGLVLEGFLSIHKTIDSFHASTNSDFYQLLSGNNPDGEAFVSPRHPIFGENKQLVDRFRTPLFFHPLSKGKVEIRSAGPDRKMFTTDDIHRTPEGVILPASDANAPSLFPPPGRRE